MAGKKEVGSDNPSPAAKTVKFDFSGKDQPLIAVKNVSKGYRKKIVLKDVNVDIFKGDIFGIIGMSGSGKTTMFQLMSGVLKPKAGDVLVKSDLFYKDKKNIPDFVSVYRNHNNVRKHFGFAAQIPSFYEHLTVEENLMMYGSLYRMKKKDVIENMDRLLKLVDLKDEKDTLAAELSGGMQRRLDIACSLIHDPEVLFLDEPTSDLDPVMRKQIWALIKEINSKGTTIVLASHILEEVENLCTKVAILHDKRVLGYGSLKDLKKLFKRNRILKVELEKGDYTQIIRKLNRIKGVEKTSKKDGTLIVSLTPDDKIVRQAMKTVDSSKDRLVSIEMSDATLNDIFETLMRKSE